VSRRFKPLDEAFPFVVVTAPADHRLPRAPVAGNKVRARVLGHRTVTRATCPIDDDDPVEMTLRAGIWTAPLPATDRPLVTLTVRAVDESGRPGQHTIRAATPTYAPPKRPRTGSDAASIGAWPENGILGTQLGPKRNGGSSSRPCN
jgi:hypothetical protein